MRHIDLFAGIAGFSLAARWAWGDEHETVAFVERDPFCQKVIARNFPGARIHSDIRDFDATQYRGTIDLLTGGAPCQPFSVAGKQQGVADERHLWPEMERVIRECRPTFVIFENVPGIRASAADLVLSDLEEAGYTARAFVVGAWAVGAPHKRDRVWIVAYSRRSAGDSGTERPGWEAWTDISGGREGSGLEYAANIGHERAGDSRNGRDGSSDASTELANPNSRRERDTDKLRRLSGQSGTGTANVGGCGIDQLGDTNRAGRRELRRAESTGAELAALERTSNGGPSFRWPSRPGQPQHEWEAPRTVANAPRRESGGLFECGPQTDIGAEGGNVEAQSRVCQAAYGLPRELARYRVAKLKALGNAVTPQVPYLIMMGIKEWIATSAES